MSLLLKKILYSACHRGIKENDIILGGFAKHLLEGHNENDIPIFCELLEESDGDIYHWIMEYERRIPEDERTIPSKYKEILLKLIQFNNRDDQHH